MPRNNDATFDGDSKLSIIGSTQLTHATRDYAFLHTGSPIFPEILDPARSSVRPFLLCARAVAGAALLPSQEKRNSS